MIFNSTIEQDHKKIMSMREGAHFYKMDLHTHTPSSECSSFSLPKVIDRLFPDSSNHDEQQTFLSRIADGEDLFSEPYLRSNVQERPRLGDPPELNTRTLRDIAGEWVEDIKKLGDIGEVKKDKNLEKKRKGYIKDGIRDMGNYLASLFFPEEFVLRCYIEGLQIVALTDHNHPGYIVPRLTALGTWLSTLEAVNNRYVIDIKADQNPGESVRETILQRLKLAQKRLEQDCREEESRIILKEEHKEKYNQKRLEDIEERKKHVAERIEYWKNPKNNPGRLVLFAGVEFTASNVHLLAVFPPLWYVPGRIGSILRAIGIPEEQWGKGFEAAASSSVQDTVTLVDAKGGIVIPAHSNSDFKGLLRLFKKGLALTKILEHKALLSLETKGGNVLSGKDPCKSLQSLDKLFKSKRKMPLTFVKGSDAHECRIELNGTGEDMGVRYSYIKLDIRPRDTAVEVFRSLRLALMNGQSRVIEYPLENTYNFTSSGKNACIDKQERNDLLHCKELRPTILGITVFGDTSYAGGIEIRFNPYLNCCVGSKGKSTIVRLVAYAFGTQSFMNITADWWLPEMVRAFWQQGEDVFCIERKGKNKKPGAPGVTARWLKLNSRKEWREINEWNGNSLKDLSGTVEIWPPLAEEEKKSFDKMREEELIERLVEQLEFKEVKGVKPLLINQPGNLFNNAKMFDMVLSRPLIKARQIIWSTGSPNVPAALDAEKIIVTQEKQIKKRGRMRIVCAGDLHEDEIRDQFVNHFEGGWTGFAYRNALYTS
jgi:hypothetical protein